MKIRKYLLKSLFKLSVVFMAFTASGCTLAVPEAGTDGYGDRLIGAFITSEYLDLYDMEGYLNDHAASLMNNSSITIGNDSRYEGNLWQLWIKKVPSLLLSGKFPLGT